MGIQDPGCGQIFRGRISIFCRVESGVREQEMPPTVTPEGFQTHQRFVAGLTPKLARTLGPALGLPTSRFHRTTANGFTGPTAGPVIHAGLMLAEASHFLGHGLGRRAAGQRGQGRFQLPDDRRSLNLTEP